MTDRRGLMDLPLLRFPPRPTHGGAIITLLLACNLPFSGAGQQVPVLTGSGRLVTIHSASQQKDKDTWHLRGDVRVDCEDMHLKSDEATYEETSGEVIGRGHVVFDDPQSHLVADEVHYNVKTKKGWFANGTGFLHPKARPRPHVLVSPSPFYFRGETVDRENEETYIINHGRMTTCPSERCGWSIGVREARITVDDKAVSHGALFRFLGIPLLYAPFMVDSIAREPRQTGFLLPHAGTSTQKGYIVGDGFFWAINPSANLLLGLEDYSKRGVAQHGEFSARPSEDSEFSATYYGVNDKIFDPTLHAPSGPSVRAAGESIFATGKDDDVGYGFRGALSVDYLNSLAFRYTWAPSFTQAVFSEAAQSGFLSKNFDAYSLNLSAERYQDFLSTQQVAGNSVVIQHLPTVDFDAADKQILNWPVYFSIESSTSALSRAETGLLIPSLSERLDVHPQILLCPKEFWHFHFTPTLGFRATHYGTSLDPNRTPINRLLAELGFDLRPPSLERVLGRTYAGRRLKHVIEPDIQYRLVRASDPENILDVVRYDELDIFTETNEFEYSLTNILLARPEGKKGAGHPQAREIFSLRLAEKYYFDPTFGGALVRGYNNEFDPTISLTGFAFAHGQRLSPLDSVLKIAPFTNFDTELRSDVSPTGGVVDAGITSNARRGRLGLSFTDYFVNRLTAFSNVLPSPTAPIPLGPSTHLLHTLVTYGDINRKGLSGAFDIDYNISQKINEQVIGQLSYNFGCFAIEMEYRRFDLGPLRRENAFRVALALANVGTFGNLRPRERLY